MLSYIAAAALLAMTHTVSYAPLASSFLVVAVALHFIRCWECTRVGTARDL
jgi:hypothetical protein